MEKNIKKIVLLIIDGWGVGQAYIGNAISEAKTPFYDSLLSAYPSAVLVSSGLKIGLKENEPGNTKAGHVAIGLGRVINRNIVRIDKAIQSGDFYKNSILLEAIERVKQANSTLHLIGLVSENDNEASIEHLEALIKLAKENKIQNLSIHALIDFSRRKKEALELVEKLVDKHGLGKIASIVDIKYAMDIHNNWKATGKAAKLISGSFKEGDSLIFFNHKPAGVRQIIKAFSLPGFEKPGAVYFKKGVWPITFVKYDKELPVLIAFPKRTTKNPLSEIVAQNNIKQIYITGKDGYAQLGHYFDAETAPLRRGEEHNLVSADDNEITDKISREVIKAVRSDSYGLIVVNFSQAKMSAKSGSFDVVKKEITQIDKNLKKISQAILDDNSLLVITASHGALESLVNMQTEEINKENSKNNSPFIIVGNEYEGKNIGFPEVPGGDLSLAKPAGTLADVAPTILRLLGIKKPKEMTGESLI